MANQDLRFRETDEAGVVTATYISSNTDSLSSRIDVITPARKGSIWQNILTAFLPVGYPHSVTPDYLEYQIYDSLQAFSSSIAGLLSSRAVLQGVGVGDASASPTAALLLSVLQESMGRIATILFAHRLGTSLEPECKMYRLAADIFNDSAMILDCLSPAFAKPARIIIFSLSSVLRSLCGVAAGSSKASLSSHFSRWGNLGELNAKDSSQETIISLMGMLAGSFVVSRVSSTIATWASLLLLLFIHLFTNYRAVRAVKMHSLNRQRANIVFSNLVDTGVVLSPEQVAAQERVFERDGALRWRASKILGFCGIGISLRSLLQSIGRSDTSSGSFRDVVPQFAELMELYHQEDYILWYDKRRNGAHIVLKQGASPSVQLKAWSHALIAAKEAHHTRFHEMKVPILNGEKATPGGESRAGSHETIKLLQETLKHHSIHFNTYVERLKAAGWDLDIAALETRPGHRFVLLE